MPSLALIRGEAPFVCLEMDRVRPRLAVQLQCSSKDRACTKLLISVNHGDDEMSDW